MDTNGKATYEIHSMSGRDLTYIVRQNEAGDWSCSCPHWQYRLAPIGGHCKHIQRLLAGGASDGHEAMSPAQALQILAQLVDAQRIT